MEKGGHTTTTNEVIFLYGPPCVGKTAHFHQTLAPLGFTRLVVGDKPATSSSEPNTRFASSLHKLCRLVLRLLRDTKSPTHLLAIDGDNRLHRTRKTIIEAITKCQDLLASTQFRCLALLPRHGLIQSIWSYEWHLASTISASERDRVDLQGTHVPSDFRDWEADLNLLSKTLSSSSGSPPSSSSSPSSLLCTSSSRQDRSWTQRRSETSEAFFSDQPQPGDSKMIGGTSAINVPSTSSSEGFSEIEWIERSFDPQDTLPSFHTTALFIEASALFFFSESSEDTDLASRLHQRFDDRVPQVLEDFMNNYLSTYIVKRVILLVDEDKLYPRKEILQQTSFFDEGAAFGNGNSDSAVDLELAFELQKQMQTETIKSLREKIRTTVESWRLPFDVQIVLSEFQSQPNDTFFSISDYGMFAWAHRLFHLDFASSLFVAADLYAAVESPLHSSPGGNKSARGSPGSIKSESDPNVASFFHSPSSLPSLKRQASCQSFFSPEELSAANCNPHEYQADPSSNNQVRRRGVFLDVPLSQATVSPQKFSASPYKHSCVASKLGLRVCGAHDLFSNDYWSFSIKVDRHSIHNPSNFPSFLRLPRSSLLSSGTSSSVRPVASCSVLGRSHIRVEASAEATKRREELIAKKKDIEDKAKREANNPVELTLSEIQCFCSADVFDQAERIVHKLQNESSSSPSSSSSSSSLLTECQARLRTLTALVAALPNVDFVPSVSSLCLKEPEKVAIETLSKNKLRGTCFHCGIFLRTFLSHASSSSSSSSTEAEGFSFADQLCVHLTTVLMAFVASPRSFVQGPADETLKHRFIPSNWDEAPRKRRDRPFYTNDEDVRLRSKRPRTDPYESSRSRDNNNNSRDRRTSRESNDSQEDLHRSDFLDREYSLPRSLPESDPLPSSDFEEGNASQGRREEIDDLMGEEEDEGQRRRITVKKRSNNENSNGAANQIFQDSFFLSLFQPLSEPIEDSETTTITSPTSFVPRSSWVSKKK